MAANKILRLDDKGNVASPEWCKEHPETEEEIESKREQQQEITEPDIWIELDNGIKKLSHKKAALELTKLYHIKTIGGKVKEIYYYEPVGRHRGRYRKDGESVISEKIEQWTEGRVKLHDIKEVVGHVQRMTFCDRDILRNDNPNEVCVGNGIFNLKTLELSPHTPEKIFTHKLPHFFKPGVDCPKFKKFLKDILKKDDIPTIQEFMGYLLYRKYNIKKAVIFVGEPDTGKTTLIKAIVKFVGEENTSGVSLHKIIHDKFSTVNLYGKMLNFYDDLSFKDIKETGEFKIVTGGGYLSAEYKFGERFEFLNHAKLLFATNKISTVMDSDDDAYYLRWLIIFFNNVFDDSNKATDKNIIEKITTAEEMEGILNWALEGLKRLLENNKFSYNKTAEENKLVMEKSSNPISAFVQDCIVEAQGEHISKENLYNIYSLYVKEYGTARVTKEKFGRDFPTKATYVTSGRKNTKLKKSEHVWFNLKMNTSNTTFLTNMRKYKVLLQKLKINQYFQDELGTMKWDEKLLVFQKCQIEDCNETPCNNDSHGIPYCKRHFVEMAR